HRHRARGRRRHHLQVRWLKRRHCARGGLMMKQLFAIRMLLLLLLALAPRGAGATGADTATVPPADPAPCQAAIAANDDDKIVGECGALIDNEKTEKPDRLKALIARGAVLAEETGSIAPLRITTSLCGSNR